MQNNLFRFLHHKMSRSLKWQSYKWYPMLAVFYLTNECDFDCAYCCDGKGTPYHQLPTQHMSVADTLHTVGEIRRHCNSLVVTGGEPLQHEHFDEVMTGIGKMRFSELALTTNGWYLDRHLPVIADTVSKLVISLDSLDATHADGLFGKGSGTLAHILDNVADANGLSNKKFEIVISTVLTPEYISDAYQVYELAQKNNWEFAACPQLQGVKAHPKLQDNRAYKDFFDFLIAQKRKNRKIFGTTLYLEYMRDLRKFDCHPFTMLVVSPTGEVSYPCLELGHSAGRLIDNPDLHKLRKEAFLRYGPQPQCDTRCHSACALGFSTLINNPWETIAKECRTKFF